MPAQDLQVRAFEINANGRVHGQTIVKVVDGLFEHVRTTNLLDKFGLVNLVATVKDAHIARVVVLWFGGKAVGRHNEKEARPYY